MFTNTRVLKRIGGHWLDWPTLNAHAIDGDKFVCMDNLIEGKPCLIYSFGIANDWTFEDFMDFRGCEIHAHDPTVDDPPNRGNNINFRKVGLGVAKDTLENVYMKNDQDTTEIEMDTLENVLKRNGHSTTEIEILKV